MKSCARIYVHHFDGEAWVLTRFSHDSERVYEALKAAVPALRCTAQDLARMGAVHDSNLALDQAALIEEVIK